MSTTDTSTADRNFQKNAMASFVQIAAVVTLAWLCLRIVAPFISVMVWGLIIAVALYPAHLGLARKLGGSQKASSILFVLVGITVLVLPTYLLTASSVDTLQNVAQQLNGGSVSIPPPDDSVADWPLVGERVHAIWAGAAENLQATINQFGDQLKHAGQAVLRFAGTMVVGVLQFIVSLIIAGAFLVSGDSGYRVSVKFSTSLVGSKGEALVDLAVATVRSVAKGVIGIAIVQALLAAIGLVAIGVPGAGIWSFVVLLFAVMQLPVLLVLGPIAVWVFSVAEPVPATVFAVYAFIVAIGDGFLKPMFLGRGLEIPMLVILLGAIGGMLVFGIIGLFIGAIVLAVGYEIMMAWMETDELNNPRPASVEVETA